MIAMIELLVVCCRKKAPGVLASRQEWNSRRVVGEGLYIDDKARICDDTLLALFSRDFAATYLLGSRAVFHHNWP